MSVAGEVLDSALRSRECSWWKWERGKKGGREEWVAGIQNIAYHEVVAPKRLQFNQDNLNRRRVIAVQSQAELCGVKWKTIVV